MEKIFNVIKGLVPLITDTKPSGERKASLGRIGALVSAGLILFRFGYLGMDPGNGILAFFASCMAYNGYSKSTAANGNGGEATTQGTTAPQEGQDG